MTILLKPKCNISKLEGFTYRIAEIIQESIENLYGYTLTIKKPNDLLLNNKKIGGILTETKVLKEEVLFLYIGIGFNVNEEIFSTETNSIATSLKREYQKEFQREDIIIQIIERLEKII